MSKIAEKRLWKYTQFFLVKETVTTIRLKTEESLILKATTKPCKTSIVGKKEFIDNFKNYMKDEM